MSIFLFDRVRVVHLNESHRGEKSYYVPKRKTPQRQETSIRAPAAAICVFSVKSTLSQFYIKEKCETENKGDATQEQKWNAYCFLSNILLQLMCFYIICDIRKNGKTIC